MAAGHVVGGGGGIAHGACRGVYCNALGSATVIVVVAGLEGGGQGRRPNWRRVGTRMSGTL